MLVAGLAEGGARDDCDVLGLQQLLAELVGAHAELRDVGEDVESPVRLEAGQIHFGEGLHKEAAALIVGLGHHLRVLVSVAQRRYRGVLAHRRRGHYAELVYLEHVLHYRRGRAGPAETPARHREGFREAVDDDGALVHSGQRRYADVALLVAELAVNFVRDYEQVVL